MTDAKTDSEVPSPARSRRRRWRWPIALLLILAFLLFDIGPTVPAPVAPSAGQADATRVVVQRTRGALVAGNGRAGLSYSADELAGAAVLASSLRSFGRFDTQLALGSARLRASRSVLGPIWINVSATVGNVRTGFPPVRLRIGRLPLGETLSRAAVALGRQVMLARGVKIAPLDTLIDGVTITPANASAVVFFPGKSGVSRGIAGLRQTPVDPVAAGRVYCHLVAREGRLSTDDFAQVVNRAFTVPTGLADRVEANRAAFVGLASYTVGSGAMRLADGMQKFATACPGARRSPMIAGRDDLPKHWTLSAALSVALGDDVSTAMGEWKELSDSRPQGSGFSFVDLAADRAGLAAAKRAIDPARAGETALRLKRAKAEDILPISALALSEGLTEAQFVARFGTIDSAAFAAATARVDQVIARTLGE